MSSLPEISSIEELDCTISSTPLLLMYFYADWCTPCNLLSPSIDKLSEDFSEVKFVKVNVELMKDIKAKYEIGVIPACIVLSQGEKVYTFYGSCFETLKDELSKIRHIHS
ncbi:hypothetical protein LOD99_3219 [Oopsacas minuta]|uniref:Thioredoxin domain-containing protein n=1 Tax=Oopsacas minuta TaxID=111878 RepID=A0AAV7JY26_9METZ|nr:hypothetical protein LOD99_3219 [Oopsacas minuta]